MNGFRIAILIFLAVALAILFWIVAYLMPQRQQMSDEQKREQESSHYDKLLTQAAPPSPVEKSIPAVPQEDPAAILQAENERLRKELELKKQEEEIIKDGARKSQTGAASGIDAPSSPAIDAVAEVVGYDKENNIVMLKPQAGRQLAVSQVLAVSRYGGIVCELQITRFDEESALYSAAAKRVELINEPSLQGMPNFSANFDPALKDKVIVSPLPQVSDLPALQTGKTANSGLAPSAPVQPAAQPNIRQTDVIDVPLTPALP